MPAPTEISTVIVSPSSQIAIDPPITVNCAMGEAFADWLRDDLVPLFAKNGKTLARLSSTSGYACRARNRVAGAKLSEHGTGNAIDIGGFGSTDGHVTGVKDGGPATPLLAEVKRTACARFHTVLGPGSDGYHESHVHIDLADRHNGYRICHWDLP